MPGKERIPRPTWLVMRTKAVSHRPMVRNVLPPSEKMLAGPSATSSGWSRLRSPSTPTPASEELVVLRPRSSFSGSEAVVKPAFFS